MQLVLAQEAVKKEDWTRLRRSPNRLEAVKQTILANAYIQDLMKSTPVTEEMLKAEYDRIKATVSGTEYHARHILVAYGSRSQGHHRRGSRRTPRLLRDWRRKGRRIRAPRRGAAISGGST